MKLSVIIPVYNEENTVLSVVEQVRHCGLDNLEIVIVNDCSTDRTAEKLAALKDDKDVVVINHEVNKGKGAAIQTAQKIVSGDVVIIQDADMEYLPSEFPRLIRPIEAGEADAVYGSRYSGREILVDTYVHYIGNLMLTTFSNILSNLHLTDMETCYKMMRTDLFKSMKLHCRRFGIEPEITANLSKRHARIYEMPIAYHPRSFNEGKKIGWKDGVAAIWYIIKYNLFS